MKRKRGVKGNDICKQQGDMKQKAEMETKKQRMETKEREEKKDRSGEGKGGNVQVKNTGEDGKMRGCKVKNTLVYKVEKRTC